MFQAACYQRSPASEAREHCEDLEHEIPISCHPPQYSADSSQTTQPSWRADAGCRFLYLRDGDSNGHATAIANQVNQAAGRAAPRIDIGAYFDQLADDIWRSTPSTSQRQCRKMRWRGAVVPDFSDACRVPKLQGSVDTKLIDQLVHNNNYFDRHGCFRSLPWQDH